MTAEPEVPRAIAAHRLGSVLAITVSPRASRTLLQLRADGTLLLRIAAPPVDGAANIAALKFLADVLRIPRSRLSLASGETSRRKRFLVEDIPPAMLAALLETALFAGQSGALQPENTPISRP